VKGVAMTTEDALLAAVAANPADDLPRLVYADWLDENDRPVRAEFIRLQIEIANKETLPRAAVNLFAHLWKRQQDLLDEHTSDLLGPLAGVVQPLNYEFRRGFLDWVSLTLRDFLNARERLELLVPMPEVRVSHAAFALDELASAPHAKLIRELSVDRDELYIGSGLGAVLTAELTAAPALARLLRLNLANCHLGDGGVRELFTPATLPALTDLDLSFNNITDAGVIDLLNTGLPQRLRRLVLGGNPIGDQGAIELADRLGPSRVLDALILRLTNVGNAGRLAISTAFGGRADLF
jgi:uncharacterized protein (TIGR02996 family)